MTKQYRIVGYAEPEEGLSRKEKIIEAESHADAMARAWREFPEYHEVGAYLKED